MKYKRLLLLKSVLIVIIFISLRVTQMNNIYTIIISASGKMNVTLN